MTDEPVDQPMEQENVQEDSQVMPFSLHLTQSQSDMGSQMPLETSQPMEGIQEVCSQGAGNDECLRAV